MKKIINKKILLIIIICVMVFIPNLSNAASVSVGQVKGVKVSARTSSTLKITWTKVSKATGYRVYIYNSSTKTYKYYGQTTTNSITIKNRSSAAAYKIKVKAYRTVKGKKYCGKSSATLIAVTSPTQTKNVKLSSYTVSSVKLTWSKVTRATGYEIYVYDRTSKKYKKYGESTTNSITLSGLSAGTTYNVKVRAYRKVNGTKYYGSFSSVLKFSTRPKQVQNLKSTKQTSTSVTLSWSKVSGSGIKYRVYVYSIYSGTFKSYSTTSSTSMTVTGLDTAKYYKFYVRAYTEVNGTKFHSAASSTLVQKTSSTSKIKAGIDVSKCQKSIDWEKVKNYGIDFAMIRIGNRGNDVGKLYEDEYFEENITGALDAGIQVGVYFYSCAITEEEATEEAKWVINKLKEYGVEDDCQYIAYDFEDYKKSDTRMEDITKSQVNKDAIAFLKYVQNKGYTPILYGNKNYLTNIFDVDTIISKVTSTKVWLANYNDTTSYTGDYYMWQYYSSGTIDGISGSVDLNVVYL